MSDQLLFQASRIKSLSLLFGLMTLVTLGGVAIIPQKPFIGWLIVAFCGLCILTALMKLRSNSVYLRLNRDGFEIVGLLRCSKYRWGQVDTFRIITTRGTRMIAFSHNQKRGKRSIYSAFLGGDRCIGNIYNAPLDEICQSLNSWRERFGRQAI